MSILQTSDFKGEFKISSTVYTELTSEIETYEKFYLLRMLGADLYNLFIADLTATTPQVPQTARFIALFDSFDIDDGSCLRTSEGIKQMLVQFVYFHFIRESNYEQTDSGVMRTVSEVSGILPYNGFNLVESYNKGIDNYNEIQWFILDDPTTYPEENIQLLSFTSGI